MDPGIYRTNVDHNYGLLVDEARSSFQVSSDKGKELSKSLHVI